MGRSKSKPAVHVASIDELQPTEFGDGRVRREHSTSPERLRTEGTAAQIRAKHVKPGVKRGSELRTALGKYISSCCVCVFFYN